MSTLYYQGGVQKCISKDVRSTPAISEGKRSRNSSEISQPRSRHTSTSSSGMGSVRTMESALRTVEMATAETKIFSVAVSQGKAENSSNMMRNVVMKVCCLIKNTNTSEDLMQIFKDVERQPVNRPVTLLPSSRPEIQGGGDLHHHQLQHHHDDHHHHQRCWREA